MSVSGFIAMALGLVVLILIVVVVFVLNRDDSEERLKEEEERKRIEEEKLRRENVYKERLQNLIDKYGEITIEFKEWGEYEFDDFSPRILIFEQSSMAYIKGQEIPFNKILAFTLADNKQTISTTTGNASTNTSTGSMVGRALVGGVLMGGVGALAGATTASRETEINTTTRHDTSHDYIIYLNIDDIANPQRMLKFGNDAELANKVASVFNIIISRN